MTPRPLPAACAGLHTPPHVGGEGQWGSIRVQSLRLYSRWTATVHVTMQLSRGTVDTSESLRPFQAKAPPEPCARGLRAGSPQGGQGSRASSTALWLSGACVEVGGGSFSPLEQEVTGSKGRRPD